MNSINLIGNVGKEIELKQTNSGKSVVTFSFAVKDPYGKDKTDWFNCVAWNKTAETISQLVCKGQQIGITGRLSTRKYEDKQGVERTATEIIVESFSFTGKKENSDSSTSYRSTNSSNTDRRYSTDRSYSTDNADFEVVEEDDDDLPW